MKNTFYTINTVALSEGQATSDVEVLRVGVIRDRGLPVTQKMLNDFVQNYNDDVYGTELQVNKDHEGGEAMGWIKNLFLDPANEARLMATIEWTTLGIEKISHKLYKFVSAEFNSKYPHHETGKLISNVFSGLALTNTPALKGQLPISLSEDIQLTNTLNNRMLKKYIEMLSARKFVSAEEKTLMHTQLEEMPAEEQEEHKEAVEAVDAKPEESPEEKKEEESKGDESEKGEDGEGKKEEAPEAAALSEKLSEVESSNQKLQDQVQKLEEEKLAEQLSARFDSKMMLSNDTTVGFSAESKDNVVSFLTELSHDQREAFYTILEAVKAVDLSEIGSTEAGNATTDLSDKIVARAEELMAKDETLGVEKAQKLAAEQLTK